MSTENLSKTIGKESRIVNVWNSEWLVYFQGDLGYVETDEHILKIFKRNELERFLDDEENISLTEYFVFDKTKNSKKIFHCFTPTANDYNIFEVMEQLKPF